MLTVQRTLLIAIYACYLLVVYDSVTDLSLYCGFRKNTHFIHAIPYAVNELRTYVLNVLVHDFKHLTNFSLKMICK